MLPIDFFWRAAQRWSARTAIQSPLGALSFGDLAGRVAALAAAYHEIDASTDGRVAICAGNGVDHLVALLAVLAAGRVWVPLNPKSTAPELRRIVDVTEPAILVLDDTGAALLDGVPGRRIHAGHGGGMPAGAATVAALCRRHAGALPPRLAPDREATQALKFTGGTTGLPKGVMQPRRAWTACIVNQIQAWGLTEDDRYVVAAPITHGTSTYLLPVLAQGGCLVLPEGTGPEAVRRAFRDHGGTLAFMPPTLIYMLMALPGTARSDYPRLRRLIYGGAPMPPEKVRQARAFFGPVLCTTYGQTEAPQIITALRPEDFDDPTLAASVGRASWFTDVAIMAPDGRLLPEGEIGEVVVRGDLVMTGYWRLPEKTAETLVNGWLHTGDRGLIDARGHLFLKDRLRDVVITGGFNVYPVDVENALGQHPAVHECAVFGLPDDKWGEAVQAAVQLRPGMAADEAALQAFVRERLGAVATPKRIHFHADLPRSPVGKVLKSTVRALALAALDHPEENR